MKWRNRTAKQQAKINRERQRARNQKRRTMKIQKSRAKKEALRRLENANTPKQIRAEAKETRRSLPRNHLWIRVNGKLVSAEEFMDLVDNSIKTIKKIEFLHTGEHSWQDSYIIILYHYENIIYYSYNNDEYIDDETDYRVYIARPYTFFLSEVPQSDKYPIGWREIDRITEQDLKELAHGEFKYAPIARYLEDKQEKQDALRSKVFKKVKDFRVASVEPQLLAAEKTLGEPLGENVQELIQSYMTPIATGYRGNLARYKDINTSLFQ